MPPYWLNPRRSFGSAGPRTTAGFGARPPATRRAAPVAVHLTAHPDGRPARLIGESAAGRVALGAARVGSCPEDVPLPGHRAEPAERPAAGQGEPVAALAQLGQHGLG